jgi:hypothetical protein
VSLYKKKQLNLEDTAVEAEITVHDLKLVAKAAGVDVSDITNKAGKSGSSNSGSPNFGSNGQTNPSSGSGSHFNQKKALIARILGKT